jgi:hypothetical protein
VNDSETFSSGRKLIIAAFTAAIVAFAAVSAIAE